jgi:hypothetical protein
MYHTPLTWYEQENLGLKAHFEAWPQSTVVSTLICWITKTLRISPTGQFTHSNPITLHSLVRLATAYADVEGMHCY